MITIESVTKSYGHFTAVDDVSFTAETGRVTGFLGPNGAGKSTTMRVLVGLTTPTTGHATIGGRRYHDLDNPGTEVGVLLDASAQHGGRTGREILDHHPAGHGPAPTPRRRDARGRQPHRHRGTAPRPRLLPGDAPAARHRRRTHGRPGGAHPRRARQRTGPAGHPVDARAPARLRRPRRHGAALVAPPARDRGRRRRPRGHRQRTDRRPGVQGRPAPDSRIASSAAPSRTSSRVPCTRPASRHRGPAPTSCTPRPRPSAWDRSPSRPASPSSSCALPRAPASRRCSSSSPPTPNEKDESHEHVSHLSRLRRSPRPGVGAINAHSSCPPPATTHPLASTGDGGAAQVVRHHLGPLAPGEHRRPGAADQWAPSSRSRRPRS